MKRTIVIYLILCFLVPISVEAKKRSFGKGLYWELSDDGTLTVSGFGIMPDYGYKKYSGQKKYKKRPWHKSCQDIRKIIIENGVTTIGDGVFYDCENLKSIKIANSVKSIGDRAFYRCGMESVVIPNSVKYVGHNAFSRCKSLKEIQIPNSVTRLGFNAFDGCVSLTSITIPSSISVIEGYLFEGCTNLVSVILPNTIKEIERNAFYGCDNLRQLYIPRSVTKVGKYAFARKATSYELYKTYDGEILTMPDFMLNGDPTQWGLSQESVDAYKYGIRDDSGKLLRSGRKGWKITKLSNDINNFYVVEEDRKMGMVDDKGKWLLPLSDNIYNIELAGNNYIKIRDKNYDYGIIDNAGNTIIPTSRSYSYIGNFNTTDKTFPVTKGRYNGICNERGEELSMTKRAADKYDIMFDGGYSNAEKIATNDTIYFIVSKKGLKGLTDAEGNVIIPAELSVLEPAGTTFLRFKVGDFYGILNYTGKIIIDTDRGYTSIGDYISFTKRFPYTMDGYKGECDITGQQISKIKVETLKQTDAKPETIIPQKQEDKKEEKKVEVVVKQQTWVPCNNCGGTGRCPYCDNGWRQLATGWERCWVCMNMKGVCLSCRGSRGHYE